MIFELFRLNMPQICLKTSLKFLAVKYKTKILLVLLFGLLVVENVP